MHARLHAHLHPKEVWGIVLVDSAHEDQLGKLEGKSVYNSYPDAKITEVSLSVAHAAHVCASHRNCIKANLTETSPTLTAAIVSAHYSVCAYLCASHMRYCRADCSGFSLDH